MTEPVSPSPKAPSIANDSDPSEPSAAPPPKSGRARAFRAREEARRDLRADRVLVALVVVIILLGAYVIVTARPFVPSNGSNSGPGAPITVRFGVPTVSSIPCASGGSAYAERIPFANSSQPISTGDVHAQFTEIWDGDFIPDFNVVANVSPADLCGGPPPDAATLWYGVLQSPNGTNLLSYTIADRWVSVSGGSWNIPIENNSAFVLVTDQSYAGSGRGFALVGYENGSLIHATIPL